MRTLQILNDLLDVIVLQKRVFGIELLYLTKYSSHFLQINFTTINAHKFYSVYSAIC